MTALEEKKQPRGEDNVSQYLREIRRFPMLTDGQELELAKRIAQGDSEAVKEMVSANLRLVVSVARGYAGRGVPLLDLIQEGSIGLIAAAKKFDYTLDFKFSTYATKWIRQGITRYLNNHAALIRVPEHTADKLRRVLQARAALIQETGEEPEEGEIAEKCGYTPERVRQLLALNPEICSLDAPAGEDATLGMMLEDRYSLAPQEELVRQELKQTLEQLLDMLTDRQRMVLRLHFGMEDGTCHSLEKIGKMLGISKERVRQIEKQAMEKLQKLGANLGLEDFLNE